MDKIGTPNSANQRIILSSAYFGPAEYFSLFAKTSHKNVWIEQMETYPKQTWRNRCTILTSQGPLDLSIPVYKPLGNHTKMHQIEINNESRWYLKHWRALTSAYNASPFFMYYEDQLLPFFKGGHDNLLDYNTLLTQQILELLRLDIKIKRTDNYFPPTFENDLRYRLSPKRPPFHQHFPTYIQVFGEPNQFSSNLSILDVLFNLGPDSVTYLKEIK